MFNKTLLAIALTGLTAFSSLSAKELNVRYVNFKTCLEQSELGKTEQGIFEDMKTKMETSLQDKEKSLNDLAAKLNNPDYLDSISPEAETDLKRKFRALNQELSQLQNQFYQVLQQTNMKVVQKMNAAVAEAAKEIALVQKIDLILNEETCFYQTTVLDISDQVIKTMNKHFQQEKKNS